MAQQGALDTEKARLDTEKARLDALPPGDPAGAVRMAALLADKEALLADKKGLAADKETLGRERAALLDQMPRLRYEVLRTPASLAPALSLGRYDSEAAANAALERLKQTGVRTAKVVQLRRAIERQLLRVNQADSATQVALSGLSLPRGQTFTACRF